MDLSHQVYQCPASLLLFGLGDAFEQPHGSWEAPITATAVITEMKPGGILLASVEVGQSLY